MSRSEERLRILERAVEEEPDDPLGPYVLGLEYAKLSRFEDAAHAFERAVDLKEDFTAAYRELGKALREAGNREEAIAALERGVRVAERTKDLQTAKEMRVFLRRLRGRE